MRIIFATLFIFISNALSAQTNAMVGVVVDAETNTPVRDCNIFISRTTRGTTSDTGGKFSMYDLPEGGSLELVVSNVGYETFIYSFSSAQLPLNLKISLYKKIVDMPDVVIIPEEANAWEKWGTVFLNGFIGETENARECEIENPSILRFRMYKNKGVLEATADAPLIIKNEALGYIIKYQLEKFEYDYKNQVITYIGYPLFEQMKFEYAIPEKYLRRRLKAYNGSLMHFFRSLYTNRLAEEGFEVREFERQLITDTVRTKNTHLVFFDSSGNRIKAPSFMIRRRIADHLSDSLSPGNTLLVVGSDSVKDVLSSRNYLQLKYLREKVAESYVNSSFIHQQDARKFQISNIYLADKQKLVFIQANGNYYPGTNLIVEGYMGWEKTGDLLPLDYVPGN